MNYHNITTADMMNGDGLRVVLWLSGCEHHCEKCQNPQTWDIKSGIEFDIDAKEELFAELDKDYISGITFSGGDPLNKNNVNDVLTLVELIRNLYPHKSIWIYTGFYWEEMFGIHFDEQHPDILKLNEKRKEIILNCDVLIDGRYMDNLRDTTLKWRGSTNQRVIDVQKTLQYNEVVLYCD